MQVIGGVMVLYRYNPELHKKAAAKKAPAKKTVEKKKIYKAKKSPFEDKKGRDKRIGGRFAAKDKR